MADILIEKDGKIEYLKSVNGAEYMLDPQAKKDEVQPKSDNILINPDISQVKGTEMKYWKIEDGAVRVMTKEEKKEVDDLEAIQIEESRTNLENLTPKLLAEALIKKGVITKEEIYG